MNTFQQTEPQRLLWNCHEAAAAMNISERTLWSLMSDGKIPCVRIGRSVRYDPSDIRAWIEAQKTKCSSAETTAETT